MGKEPVTVDLPIAFNDPPGDYEIAITELFTNRTVTEKWTVQESFELLLKFGKSSFLRKQESSLFKTFWIPAFAGMTKRGHFSKVSSMKCMIGVLTEAMCQFWAPAFQVDSRRDVCYVVLRKEVTYEPDTHYTNP